MSTTTHAPSGRETVTGTVLSVKTKISAFTGGEYEAMTVQLTNGSKVWSPVPKGIMVRTGDRVTFTATFKQKEGDPTFAFGSKAVMGTPLKAPLAATSSKPEVFTVDSLTSLADMLMKDGDVTMTVAPVAKTTTTLEALLAEFDEEAA